jgi:hypothetical protein
VDDPLRTAVELFNTGHYAEFQDAVEGLISGTRAVSERQFLALLDNLAESLLQLSDGDLADAQAILSAELRRLDEFVPRFRRINTEALRDDLRLLISEMRAMTAGTARELAPSKLPRLRLLPE